MTQISNQCLVVKNISKQYPGTLALDKVNFTAEYGKVNILVGENGAGKSTLMKIVAGIVEPSDGQIFLDGKEVQFKSTIDAKNVGIGIIHQELNLLPNMKIYQNIFVAREEKKGLFLDNEVHIEKTRLLLEKLEHSLDPELIVSQLRVGQQQIVEIAKTMAQENLKVLIMDEPTSSLSAGEVKVLFKIIAELKAQGLCIIYISHRLDEVVEIGDNITVLRDGTLVEQRTMEDVDISWIVHAMVGKNKDFAKKIYNCDECPMLLETKNLTLPASTGGYSFKDVNVKLKAGKILGVYGLLGSGRTELLETLMGMHKYYTGEIIYDNRSIKAKNIATQIASGFVLVPENRQVDGLIQTMNIAQNTALSSLKNNRKRGILSNASLRTNVSKIIADLKIKVADAKLPILSLSGGNQQKVVIGKGLLTNPKILLLDEPSRGIDIGAKADVFEIIQECANNGLGIIVVSSELKEIIAISDEIIVLRNGYVSGVLEGDEICEEALMQYATSKLDNEEVVGE